VVGCGVLVVVAVTLLLGGCSPAPGGDGDRPGSRAEATERFAECMTERGWIVTVDPVDGGVSAEFSSDQEDAYSADTDACYESTGANQARELTQDDYAKGYAMMLESLECLRNEGVDLPDAPSYQAYVDLKGMYTPYRDMPDGRYEELLTACPQPQLW
jgi:hypothetical protein